MIFLDANAFYSYFGRDRLGMTSTPVDEAVLTKFLEQRNDKSIPTSVYVEIVTHFRNSLDKLLEIIKFMRNKNLRLYNNIPDYIVDEVELTCVNMMSKEHLCNYARKLLCKKIEIESRFTLLFFEITKDLYTHYKLTTSNVLSEDNKESILDYIGRKGYKEYGKILEEKIKDELDSGYEENKEQKVLKDFYIHELNEWCVFVDMIIAGCEACKDESSDLIEIMQNAYQNDIAAGMDGTMSCIVNALSIDSIFLQDAKTKIAKMFTKAGYSKTQRVYMREVMFTAWFERGQKLQKNDIFDMFCVGCLDAKEREKKQCVLIDTTSYILSFDKRMKRFLGSVRPHNLKIIEELENV